MKQYKKYPYGFRVLRFTSVIGENSHFDAMTMRYVPARRIHNRLPLVALTNFT